MKKPFLLQDPMSLFLECITAYNLKVQFCQPFSDLELFSYSPFKVASFVVLRKPRCSTRLAKTMVRVTIKRNGRSTAHLSKVQYRGSFACSGFNSCRFHLFGPFFIKLATHAKVALNESPPDCVQTHSQQAHTHVHPEHVRFPINFSRGLMFTKGFLRLKPCSDSKYGEDDEKGDRGMFGTELSCLPFW